MIPDKLGSPRLYRPAQRAKGRSGSVIAFFAAATLLAVLPFPGRAASPKLYWFIPDGMRADPYQFDVFKLAEEGQLPHIRQMMREGAYGYSIPTYPGHTPVNFATLLTGSYPERHGVSDGPMRIEGAALERPSVSGFSSTAKKVPAIWKVLEAQGLKVALVSIPGSTPPELNTGITIRGRWGGWGAEFHAINFQTKQTSEVSGTRSSRLFYEGPELTRYISARPASGWTNPPKSFSPPLELELSAYGATVYAFVYSPSAREMNYSRVLLSYNKKDAIADLGNPNEWSDWRPIDLHWGSAPISSRFKACLIKLDSDGFIRLRFLYDILNPTIVDPGAVSDEIEKGVGPMVDFPDNWPAQLNRFPEDKPVLFAEAHMALDWHRRLVPFIFKEYSPDVFLQDTYTPNQMLESRWWLRYLDRDAPDYGKISEAERKKLWDEMLSIYKGLDDILGAAIAAAPPNSLIVLSSDHGVIPVKRELRLNNFLAQRGFLKYDRDTATGEPRIEWARTTAIHLKMIGIYLHPAGLAGPWKRGSGPEYEKLRSRVASALEDLKDTDGTKPFDRIVNYEDAGDLHLPIDRVPDLVLVVHPGYALTEEMGDGTDVFVPPLQAGYKQALAPENTPGLWTPFVIMGPGVKKGHKISKPLRHVDQVPTLLTLMGIPIPAYMQGTPVKEIFENPSQIPSEKSP